MFALVIYPEVESTNNGAKGALKPSVIYEKVLGGSRAERGGDTYARLSSV
ncbi:MAG: hypothetical protein ACYCSO_06210 [Cuniculiplasma sp.]